MSDNVALSIVLDAHPRISDCGAPDAGKSPSTDLRLIGSASAVPAPLSGPKTAPSRSRRPRSPWCTAPTRGKCWLGVGNRATAAAFAAVPTRGFWARRHGLRPRHSAAIALCPARPVVLYQDLLIALDPGRGVNNGCTPSAAPMRWNRSPASTSSMSASAPGPVIARSSLSRSAYPVRSGPSSSTLPWPAGPRSSFRAATYPSRAWCPCPPARNRGRQGICEFCRVWPSRSLGGESRARGRLVFSVGSPGPRRPNSGGRHSIAAPPCGSSAVATSTRRKLSQRRISSAPREISRPIQTI